MANDTAKIVPNYVPNNVANIGANNGANNVASSAHLLEVKLPMSSRGLNADTKSIHAVRRWIFQRDWATLQK